VGKNCLGNRAVDVNTSGIVMKFMTTPGACAFAVFAVRAVEREMNHTQAATSATRHSAVAMAFAAHRPQH